MKMDPNLRKKWVEAGYLRGRGSDAVCLPPSKEFVRLYYLTSAEHALSNIIFKRLKVSRFNELNDPFELLGQNFADVKVRKIVRDNKIQLNKAKGLVCFSEDWVDPVLWSHYATKHRGVALGFDVAVGNVKKVSYERRRLDERLNTKKSILSDEFVDALTYTKFESWLYEREWRMIVDLENADIEGNLFFCEFDAGLILREVIFGSSCDMNLKKTKKIVADNFDSVVVFKSRLALRSFRIMPLASSVR